MSIATDLQKGILDSSGAAKDLFGTASDGAKQMVLNALGGTSGGQPKFLQNVAKTAAATGTFTPQTQSLLQSVGANVAPKKSDFLTALGTTPGLSENSKKILSSIQAYEPQPLDRWSQLNTKEGRAQIYKEQHAGASTAGDKLLALADRIKNTSEVAAQKDETSGYKAIAFAERTGSNVLATSFEMIGTGLKEYSKGEDVNSFVHTVLGLAGFTPGGAVFNAVASQPGVSDVLEAVGEGMQVASDATKKFIGLDVNKHPEASAGIDAAFQFLPYILAGGAIKKAGGKISGMELTEKLKDPNYQLKIKDVTEKIIKDAKKGDFSKIERIAGQAGADKVRELLTTKEEPPKPIPTETALMEAPKAELAKAESLPEVSTKAVPKSIQDLPTTEQAKKFILKEGETLLKTNEKMKEITTPQTFEQWKVGAESMDLNLETLQQVAKESKGKTSMIVAGMQKVADVAEVLKTKVEALSKTIDSLDPDTRLKAIEEVNLLQAEYDAYYVAIREILAEQGRGLVATQVLKSMKKDAALMKEMSGRQLDAADIKTYGEKLATGAKSGEVFGTKRLSFLNKAVDAVAGARTASLLWSPESSLVNVESGLTKFFMTLPERILAGAINKGESLVRGKKQEVFMREGAHVIEGAYKGILPGLSDALKILIGKDLGKGETAKFSKNRIPVIGPVMDYSFKLQQAGDAILRQMFTKTELTTEALRTAKAEGLKGSALELRIKELKENPTAKMQENIKAKTAEGVFQEELKKGGMADTIKKWRNSDNPLFRFAAKIIFSFVDTPTNINRQTFLQRTPLAIFSNAFWENIARDPAARATALSRLTIGTGLTALGVEMALSGQITGAGPKNSNELNLLYNTGWRPYSINLGGEWYSYKRLFPLNVMFGIPATMAERYEDTKDEELTTQLGAMAQGFATTLLDQTYLQGFSDVLAWATGSYTQAEYVQETASSFVPFSGGLRWLRNLNDKFLRENDTVWEKIQNLMPGMSEELVQKVDFWGRPIEKASTLPGSLPTSSLPPDLQEVQDEFELLQYYPGVTSGTHNQFKYDKGQVAKFLEVTGEIKSTVLPAIVKSDEYQNGTMQEKYDLLSKAIDKINEKAWGEGGASLMAEQIGATQDPEVVERVYEKLRDNIYGFDDFTQEKKEEILLDMLEELAL